MESMRYVLYDQDHDRVFIGIHEGGFYFSDDSAFISKMGINKVVTFDNLEELYSFKSGIEVKTNLQLTQKNIKCKDKYATVIELSKAGLRTAAKNLFDMDPVYFNTIH